MSGRTWETILPEVSGIRLVLRASRERTPARLSVRRRPHRGDLGLHRRQAAPEILCRFSLAANALVHSLPRRATGGVAGAGLQFWFLSSQGAALGRCRRSRRHSPADLSHRGRDLFLLALLLLSATSGRGD